MAEPPSEPAVNATESDVFDAMIDEMVGALGVVDGVTEPDVYVDPVPTLFVALTLKV
jgi:hypothetical protein